MHFGVRYVIQELPEKTPTGQLPRYVEVIAEEDLVDLAKPGDRIEICGVYLSGRWNETKWLAMHVVRYQLKSWKIPKARS